MPRFAPDEVRWAVACGAVVLALATLPYLAAWMLTPAGHQYTWVLSSAFDVFSYYAKIQQSVSGAWLLHLPYTADPHAPAFLFPQYLLLGKLGASMGLPNAALYHLLRVVGGGALLAAAYLFIATVAQQVAVRRAAFLFTGLGGGFSWLTGFFGVIGTDTTVPETNTFHILLVNPHFALATAALLSVVNLMVWSGLRLKPLTAIAATVLATAAVMMQPFFVLLSAGLTGSFTLLSLLRHGVRAPGSNAWFLLPACAAVATAGLMWLELQGNATLRAWTAQNQNPTPPPLHLLTGYGVLIPLAVIGGIRVWRTSGADTTQRSAALVALAWVLAVPVMVYLPGQVQRRLAEGSHVPLSVLAALGLWWLAQRWGPTTWPWLRLGAMATLITGTFWMSALMVVGASTLRIPFYLPDDDTAALQWFQQNAAPGEIVLASPTMGNVIPGYAPVRAYWGHAFETVDATAKLGPVIRFFSAAASERERCQLLADGSITYVYEGAVERRDLAGATLREQRGLAVAFTRPEATVYRVTGCSPAP